MVKLSFDYFDAFERLIAHAQKEAQFLREYRRHHGHDHHEEQLMTAEGTMNIRRIVMNKVEAI